MFVIIFFGEGEVGWGSHQTILSFIFSGTLLIIRDKLEPATLQTLAIPQNRRNGCGLV